MWQKRNKKSVFFFKGSVTVFALLLMFILAATTISIISTAAIERKISISTGNSTTAFQIAESGMEKTLQYFKSNFDKTLNDISSFIPCANGIVTYNSNNTLKFRDNIDPPDNYITNCGAPISSVKIIKSIGTTKQETRAIENDVFFGATKLLLHLNGKNAGKFEDSSFYWKNHSPVTTSDGVSVESDDSSNLIKFGEGSAKFDGTTGYLSVPDSNDWNFKTGDFTIDLWVRFLVAAGTQTLMERENSNLSLYYSYSDGYFYGIGSQFSWIPEVDTWYHIALVRQSGILSMYVDGSPKGDPSSNPTNINSASPSPLYIGTNFDQTQPFNGYMDEIRISKGIARWTANFDPYNPTAEYWPD